MTQSYWDRHAGRPTAAPAARRSAARWHARSLMDNYGTPPVALVRGKGATVWDADGNGYLDLLAGIAVNALGHAHPASSQAVTAPGRARSATSPTCVITSPAIALAERLAGAARRPDAPGVLLQLRRRGQRGRVQGSPRRTGRTELVAAEGALPRPDHGRAGADRQARDPRAVRAAAGRGRASCPTATSRRCAPRSTTRPRRSSLEPIQGEAASIPPPPGYLPAAREITARHRRAARPRRGPDRHRPHRPLVRPPGRRASQPGRRHPRQGPRRRPADRRLHRPSATRPTLLAAGHHGSTFGGNPVACAAGAGRARHHRARRPAGPASSSVGAAAHRGHRRPGPPGGPGVRGARPAARRSCSTAPVAGARRGGAARRGLPRQRRRAGRGPARAAAGAHRRRRPTSSSPRCPPLLDAVARRHGRPPDAPPLPRATTTSAPAEQARGARPGRRDEGRPLRPPGCSPGPRAVAVIFDKPSTRTRVSFAVGIAELGGYPLVIDAGSSQLGRGETIEDTARVLAGRSRAIVRRTFGQDRIEELAAVSARPGRQRPDRRRSTPARSSPTCRPSASSKGALAGLTLTYLGDGANNMAHSYLLGGATAGHARAGRLARRATCPIPAGRRRRRRGSPRQTGGSVQVTDRPAEAAAEGADVLAHRHLGLDGPGGRAAERGSRRSQPYALDEAALSPSAADDVDRAALPARLPRQGDRRLRHRRAAHARSGTRRRTGCTPRRRCWPGCSERS